MEEVKVKSNTGIIIFLIIALCGCAAFITYLLVKPVESKCETKQENEVVEKEENKEETTKEEIGSYPNLYTTNLNKANIITLFDRYIHVNGFVYEPYLEEMKFDKVTYIGYHENEKYYQVTGSYTCNTTAINCYYTPQDAEPNGTKYDLYSGIIVFEKDANSEKYTLKSLYSGMSNEDYTEVNQEIN